MNRIQRMRRCLAGLSRQVGTQLAFAALAPAAARWPDPPPPPAWKFLPGWNKYLPLPPDWHKHPVLPLGHIAGPVYRGVGRIPAHAAATADVPGWQIIVIAAGVMLLAALAVLVHRLRAARRRPTVKAA